MTNKIQEKNKKVFYYYDRLFELWQEQETKTYTEIGAEQDQFCRHVSRLLGYIHISIDIYNKLNNLKVPHIVALIINKKKKSPGEGCLSTQHDVFKFTEYAKHKEPIRKILEFVVKPSYAYIFKYESYQKRIDEFCELIKAQKGSV
jgi:hypothetical protein